MSSIISHDLKPETLHSLQDMIVALDDSRLALTEASEGVGENHVAEYLRSLAQQRWDMASALKTHVVANDQTPKRGGSFLGTLRQFWTSLRAAINGGNAYVVLIEVEKAEDVILNQFRKIVDDLEGTPIHGEMVQQMKLVEESHARIRLMRDSRKS